MIRVVSFVSFTDEGVRDLSSLADVVAKVREIVRKNGGELEAAWQTAGIYDVVAVLSFPTIEAEFRARNEVYGLGFLRAEHVPAVPLDEALRLITSGTQPD